MAAVNPRSKVKPGTKRDGKIWTGQTWVPIPRLRAKQIALENRIRQNQTTSRVKIKAGPVTIGLGKKKAEQGDAERSWRSRSAQSGTVGSAMSSARRSTSRSATSGTVGSAMAQSKPAAAKPKKTKTPKPSKPAAPVSQRSAGGSKPAARPAAKPSAAGGGRKSAVSQSRTMWVKKGTVVNGKKVEKGYVAQYGKPEKKVTNRVRTTGGKTVQYKAGRRVKKK